MKMELSEKELLEFWEKIKDAPIRGGGIKHPRVLSFKQTGKYPPRWQLALREREPLNPAYLRFLEKRMREWYNLEGVPITIFSKNIKK
jgi:predicted GTPase